MNNLRDWLNMAVRAGATLTAAIALVLTMGSTTGADTHTAAATPTAFDAATADRAALAVLSSQQNPATGLWPITGSSSWWTSANALTTQINASRALGTHQYDAEISRTYTLDRDYTGPEFRNAGPDFKNNYYDDTGWWGLAWLDAYQWTGDRRYLATAEDDDTYLHSARTTDCGGGIHWAVPIINNGQELNAITNELSLELSARLATITGRSTYRTQALADWRWLAGSHLISADGLVRDHLTADCHPDGATWSYTQGTLSAGLAALAKATGQPSYLVTARQLANAATTSRALNPGGVLTDPCEPGGLCANDSAVLKGADVRGLAALNGALPDHPYTAYLTRLAMTVYGSDRLAGDRYGSHWGGEPDSTNPSRQGAAVDLLTAVA